MASTKHRENNNQGPESLEFEEDSYIAFVAKSDTPSFDPEWAEDDDDCMFVIVDEDFEEPPSLELEESCRVETEFFDKRTGRNRFIRGVRVKFQDLSKPYLARITSQKNYYKFLQLVKGGQEYIDSACAELKTEHDSFLSQGSSLVPQCKRKKGAKQKPAKDINLQP